MLLLMANPDERNVWCYARWRMEGSRWVCLAYVRSCWGFSSFLVIAVLGREILKWAYCYITLPSNTVVTNFRLRTWSCYRLRHIPTLLLWNESFRTPSKCSKGLTSTFREFRGNHSILVGSYCVGVFMWSWLHTNSKNNWCVGENNGNFTNLVSYISIFVLYELVQSVKLAELFCISVVRARVTTCSVTLMHTSQTGYFFVVLELNYLIYIMTLLFRWYLEFVVLL